MLNPRFSSTWRITLAAFLFAFMLGSTAAAQIDFGGFGSNRQNEQFFDSRDQVKTSIQGAFESVPRGGDLPIAIIFNMNPGWHLWPAPGPLPEGTAEFDGAIRTEINLDSWDKTALTLHPGFMQWPELHSVRANLLGEPENFAVLSGRAIVYLPVTIPDNAPLGETTLTVKLIFQTCDDSTCLAPVYDHELKLTVNIIESGGETNEFTTLKEDFVDFPMSVFSEIHGGSAPPPAPSSSQNKTSTLNLSTIAGVSFALLMAVVGGFILNFTPCVLPIIPLKIMGLARSAGNRRKTFTLGMAMSLGIVAFFMAIGFAISTLNNFTAINQLFQYPVFTISIGILIAVLAVGMCGMFSMQLPQFVYRFNPSHETHFGSFLFGVMAAILSTPCTAPFMGSAAAAAVGQSTGIVLTVFAAIGIGMALPYLILSAWPHMVEKMPRTGPASELIKQVMGALLLAAAAYFIGVGISGSLVTPPAPPSRLYMWVVFACTAGAGFWLAWRTLKITRSFGKRVVFAGLGLLLIPTSIYGGIRLSSTDSAGPIAWVYYTPEQFQQARNNGQVVVMEFTAEWCLNCKLLEKNVLHAEAVYTRLAHQDVTPMKVDLTGNNTEGRQMLATSGSVTIPWLVIYPPVGEPVFAQNWYTPDMVLEAIENAAGISVASSTP